MHDLKEIAKFRKNVTNKYVTEVMRVWDARENNKTKICKKCGIELPLTDFYKHPLKKKGVTDYCKFCIRKNQKKYREKIKKIKIGGLINDKKLTKC